MRPQNLYRRFAIDHDWKKLRAPQAIPNTPSPSPQRFHLSTLVGYNGASTPSKLQKSRCSNDNGCVSNDTLEGDNPALTVLVEDTLQSRRYHTATALIFNAETFIRASLVP